MSDNISINVIISNEQPILASDLASLLNTLADDYRRMHKGHALIVTRVESGSVLLWLQDIAQKMVDNLDVGVGAAKAAKRLIDFSKALRDLFQKAQATPKQSDLFHGRRTVGVKSIEKLIEISARTNANVEFRVTASELYFRVEPVESRRIKEEAQAKELEKAEPNHAIVSAEVASVDADKLAQRLIGLANQGGDDAVSALISAFAASLEEAGMAYVLESVAANLDQSGHGNLADLVRQSFHRPSGGVTTAGQAGTR